LIKPQRSQLITRRVGDDPPVRGTYQPLSIWAVQQIADYDCSLHSITFGGAPCKVGISLKPKTARVGVGYLVVLCIEDSALRLYTNWRDKHYARRQRHGGLNIDRWQAIGRFIR